MSLLDSLLGSGQQRQEYQDFTQRYDQGPPWQGISDQEACSRFQQVRRSSRPGCTSSRRSKPSSAWTPSSA